MTRSLIAASLVLALAGGVIASDAADADTLEFVSIAAGDFATTYAIMSDGSVTRPGKDTTTTVSGLAGAVAITAGVLHACAVISDGTARCWGQNAWGQLGDGTTTNYSSTPVAVAGLTDAVDIAAGRSHTCAVISDGTARCWGDNLYGQLGNPTALGSSPTPVPVLGLTGAVAITTGDANTCALISDGTARCWGYPGADAYLCLTVCVRTSPPIPAPVPGLIFATSISGRWAHTCAVISDGTARCWGEDRHGDNQRGTGVDPEVAGFRPPILVALPVLGISSSSGIAAGYYHTCALISDATARCWGRNSNGQLGDGTTASSSTPVTVSELSDAIALSAGHSRTCAIIADGTARCWGEGFGLTPVAVAQP